MEVRRTIPLVVSIFSVMWAACQPSSDEPAGTADSAETPSVEAVADGGPGLPVGEYQCMDTYTALGEGTKISHKELLIIEGGETYRFRRNGPTGTYAFHPAMGTVEWLTGPYAGGNPTGSYAERDGQGVITLNYTFENLGSDEDFCLKLN